jgi:all-trans-retinol 13,14-reductase
MADETGREGRRRDLKEADSFFDRFVYDVHQLGANPKRRTEMKIAEPYVRASRADSYDAIVIGSGIGGLAAAALLARYGGKRVLVLERHYTLGGYTHVFHRPGYEWDVGVHYIGEVQPGTMLRRIFDAITDGRLEWADMGAVYDRVVLGEEEEFAFVKGRENLRVALRRRFPAEAEAIDAYFGLVGQVVASSRHFFMEKAIAAPIAALLGPFLRRRFLRLARRTTREVLESLTGDQRLIGVLTAQWGDYGLPPGESSFAIHALVANHYFEGGFYPVGGAGRIAETIVPLIAAAGGRALVNAEVDEIVIENGHAAGVRMRGDGAVLRAPLVISDAGAPNTFGRLVPEETCARLGLRDRMAGVSPSIAHLCLYVGLKQTAAELGLPRSNLWIYPDEHHDATFAAARRGDETLPFVYVSFPSAKDPDFARRHPGRATIDVVTAVSYEPFTAWAERPWKKRGTAYEATKERLARQLLEVLYAHVPQVKGEIDTFELSTPLTTRHFCNYATGEIYGLDHNPQRFEQRWLRPRTGVPGLFLTGQDVASCGVAGALMGGVLSASAILGKNLLAKIASSHRRTEVGSGGVEPGSASERMPSAA